MVIANDENGQILLSGAFLFAIAIAIIAVMLSNVLYSNNVAYLGFSEQSLFDDSSRKHMIIEEMNYEYNVTKGNNTWYFLNTTTFTSAINNITLTKGIYFKNIPTFIKDPFPTSSQSDVVIQQIYVYGKNFNMTYTIHGNYVKPPEPATYTIITERNPGNVIVKLGFVNTSNTYTLIADVTNSTTYMPEPGVKVTFYKIRDGVTGLLGTNVDYPYTDENGRNVLITGITLGKYEIYAQVNTQRSNKIIVSIE